MSREAVVLPPDVAELAASVRWVEDVRIEGRTLTVGADILDAIRRRSGANPRDSEDFGFYVAWAIRVQREGRSDDAPVSIIIV